jgi:flavodoxin I
MGNNLSTENPYRYLGPKVCCTWALHRLGAFDEIGVYYILGERWTMKTLVIYDSVYGNTKAVAQAIGDGIPGEVRVLHVGQVNANELETADLLIIGSPTHGGGPTEGVQALVERIGAFAHEGAKVATFDTRFASRWVKMFGFAAPRMADSLKEKGWTLTAEPEGFFVKGARRGPLKQGEAERASAWAKEMVESEIY